MRYSSQLGVKLHSHARNGLLFSCVGIYVVDFESAHLTTCILLATHGRKPSIYRIICNASAPKLHREIPLLGKIAFTRPPLPSSILYVLRPLTVLASRHKVVDGRGTPLKPSKKRIYRTAPSMYRSIHTMKIKQTSKPDCRRTPYLPIIKIHCPQPADCGILAQNALNAIAVGAWPPPNSLSPR